MAMQHGSSEEGTCPKAVCLHRPCFCPPGSQLPYFMLSVYLPTIGTVQGCQGNFTWSLEHTPGTSDHAHLSRQPSGVPWSASQGRLVINNIGLLFLIDEAISALPAWGQERNKVTHTYMRQAHLCETRILLASTCRTEMVALA